MSNLYVSYLKMNAYYNQNLQERQITMGLISHHTFHFQIIRHQSKFI